MKIFVTPTSFMKPENAAARAKLEAFADEVVYSELGRPLTAAEIPTMADGADGYIAGLDFITAEAVQGLPDTMRVISRYGAGVDRVDLAAATKRGITVTNTPGTNAIAVCELAFGLMLSAARRIPAQDRAVRSGEWPRIQGTELHGKTLGVVGLGAIGKNLALRAQAFGMRVLAYDPYLDVAFAKEHGMIGGSTAEDLQTLIAQADFISLHVPLNEQTRHLIDEKAIACMKDGAVIINTARGGILDEQAAADALASGKLGGVCVDAFEEEPVKSSPLLHQTGTILSPHAGAHTREAVAAMGMAAVENLIAVLSGQPCKSIVNKA